MTGLLNILHFNDVYNIASYKSKSNNTEIGGAAKFQTFINEFKRQCGDTNMPLILFSGDFLSPSDMSTVTNGEHMIPIMNNIGIDCAMIGNHDLDYGNEHCIKLFKLLNYPVLNTNVLTPIASSASAVAALADDNNNSCADVVANAAAAAATMEPLGQCLRRLVLEHNGYRIGVLGISEDWTETLPIKPENGIVYLDFIDECQRQVDEMRTCTDTGSDANNNGGQVIDLMIVLTHSRLPNDQLLASSLTNVDLILGGHDHGYFAGMNVSANASTMIVKSGSDFKNLTWIQLSDKLCQKTESPNPNPNPNPAQNENTNLSPLSQTNEIANLFSKSLNDEQQFMNEHPRWTFHTRYYNIDEHIAADADTAALVYELSHAFQEQITQHIGTLQTALDARFSILRTQESTAGNLITDVIRRAYHCDGVLLCGGAIRADRIIEEGVITYKDILDLVPFQDAIVVIEMTGQSVIDALEHSVCGVPKMDGKFPQISGLRFVYDPNGIPGESRVQKVWIARYIETDVHTIAKSVSVLQKQQQQQTQSSVDNGTDASDEKCFELFELIDPQQMYKIATRTFLYNGGDGFTSFKADANKVLMSEDEGLPMSTIMRNFFWSIDCINRAFALKVSQQKQIMKTRSQSPSGNATLSPSFKLSTILADTGEVAVAVAVAAEATDALNLRDIDEHKTDAVENGSEMVSPLPNLEMIASMPIFGLMKRLSITPATSDVLSIVHLESFDGAFFDDEMNNNDNSTENSNGLLSDDFICVGARIEHRIMTVTEEEEYLVCNQTENEDIGNNNNNSLSPRQALSNPSYNYRSANHFQRLPSFVAMTCLPTDQSLQYMLDDVSEDVSEAV